MADSTLGTSLQDDDKRATHTFDCFECAIHALAPRCAHCQVGIVGHGVEAEGRFFCCAHCARQSGAGGVRDRAP